MRIAAWASDIQVLAGSDPENELARETHLANGAGKRLECAAHLNAPVAQLDRVLGFEPSGREFESLRARHTKEGPHRGLFLYGAPG